MTVNKKVYIGTLNVKGLNNQEKQRKTLTLLKSYKLDIILLQETNLDNQNTQNFLKQQWPFDSVWADKTAILAGKRNIKLQDIHISYGGRIISLNISYKNLLFQITNVYAPPNTKDRNDFFEKWSPHLDKDKINIIAGDFNTNLDPITNRISQAPAQNDPTRAQLKRLTNNFIDSVTPKEGKPFLMFFQNTRNNQTMATRLDYIFIDENHENFIEKTETLFGNSDHLLVKCTLNLNSETRKQTSWRFDKNCFKNKLIEKEVTDEIKTINLATEWDWHKICIQSIIRAFRKSRAPENRLTNLNKKITKLKEILARDPEQTHLYSTIDDLNLQIQEGLLRLAGRWQTRSKANIVIQGGPAQPGDNQVLQYIKEQYTEIYKKENIDLEAANTLTNFLPTTLQQDNEALSQEITKEEIIETIRNLPNNKSPGIDGLTYEFYKQTEEHIVPALEIIFNQILNSGILPKSWHKNLITLIPKKASNLDNIDN